MERILPVYVMLIAIIFAVVLAALREDESLSRKWANVRVRVDENRAKGTPDQPRMPKQADEEFDVGRALAFMVLGMMMLLIFMLFSKV